MLDTGDIVYRDLAHKQKYEKSPELFQMCKISFDGQDMSKIKRIVSEKTGEIIPRWRAEEVARQLGCQLIEE